MLVDRSVLGVFGLIAWARFLLCACVCPVANRWSLLIPLRDKMLLCACSNTERTPLSFHPHLNLRVTCNPHLL